MLVKKYTEGRESHAGGDAQPLTHWEKLGYNTDLIINNTPPHGNRENPQLGTTYRVRVEGSKDFLQDIMQKAAHHADGGGQSGR